MTTDLPFKTSERTIVILKDLPVMQCERCSEYSVADATFERVEGILAEVDSNSGVGDHSFRGVLGLLTPII
jgi:YgiT-type zinc finger domain-containing protein